VWRSRSSGVALAVVVAAALPAIAAAQVPDRLPVQRITLPVSELTLTEASADGAVEASESAGAVRVTVAADELFPEGRAALLPEARRLLGDAARRIGASRPQEVVVEAHTDRSDSAAADTRLTQRRAEAVASALEELLGPAAPGFQPVGRGARDPVVPGAGAANRRVTVAFER
jgi:outer membrane protein OmpA-like peptidoglycan-associated protein